jgi:deferrochelatase/peroxidase EfeB
MPAKVSRRSLLGGGAAAAGVAGAFVAGRASEGASGEPATRPAAYAFRGTHQAGIVTPAQDRLHFAAFDVTTSDRDALVELLER